MGKSKRKKKRTAGDDDSEGLGVASKPRTFVMERGSVGRVLHELMTDLRQVMEPYTASKLKVTKRNVLKDFIHIAGPLGVTHFIMISKTNDNVNFKITKLPRGPTVTFHLTQFSLAKEVISNASKPLPSGRSLFLTPAMLVLNNFPADDKPSHLISTMLQNMFPTLNVQTVKLSLIKRCTLWSYNRDTCSIDFRHYGIRVVPRGMSRGVRKITQSKIPNLSKYEDISEYILGGGASESEGEEIEGEVTLPQDLPGRGNIKKEQSAIRLYEIGPRMTLQLVKIEAGVCDGEVLHHQFVHKSLKESKLLNKRIKEKKKLKLKRKREQEENVLRKQQDKEMQRKEERKRQGLDDDDDDDAEWYRKEVGVAPDSELLLRHKKLPKKRKLSEMDDSDVRPSFKKKRSIHEKPRIISSKKNYKTHSSSKTITKKIYTGKVFRKKSSKN